MTRPAFRRLLFAAIAAPLVLGLASCGKDNGETGGLSGDPIAKIASPAGKAWSDVVVKTPEGGYRMGNPDAPIKLVEFGSMTCGHCAEFAHKATAQLRDDFVASGRVSFEFRNFVRDPIDLSAALLARCGAPESFHALTDQIFANQAAIIDIWNKADQGAKEALEGMKPELRLIEVGKLTGLTDFVAARGVAKDQANACLGNIAEASALSEGTNKQAELHDITGTPSFLINGAMSPDNTWEAIKARLETLGAR